MGIDYKNVIMYGKEFESFREALDHLLYVGEISEEQYEEDLSDGEISSEYLEWELYNAYQGGYGVLGVTFSAKTLYTEPNKVEELSDMVSNKLGEGCEMHEFVKVY